MSIAQMKAQAKILAARKASLVIQERELATKIKLAQTAQQKETARKANKKAAKPTKPQTAK
jgi:hypothetical protein